MTKSDHPTWKRAGSGKFIIHSFARFRRFVRVGGNLSAEVSIDDGIDVTV